MTAVALALALATAVSAGPALGEAAHSGAIAGSTPHGGLRLLVEPQDGLAPLDALLAGAHRSVDIVMYEIDDPVIERELAADASRGVRVRVILNRTYTTSENAGAFAYLRARGVAVRWASSRFFLTHEKSVVVDRSTAVVMTLNLTPRYYTTSRDFAVVDTVPADVAAIKSAFSSDWTRAAMPAPDGADLVWSPGSQSALVALLATARHSALVENEEMHDPAITAALADDARRGVRVEITMTANTYDDPAFAALAASGVAVRLEADTSSALYIHAKAIVVDAGYGDARAFVGSENFSVASLVYNRELGIITRAPRIVAGLAGVLRADFAAAAPWR